MIYTLNNGYLTIQVESKGAELKSVKDNGSGIEYMWSGEEKYWGKTSPILFPFVGTLKNGEYQYEGRTYKMSRHGFARDMEFDLKEQSDEKIIFSLNDNEETREKYPFCFTLEIEYKLECDILKVNWRVANRSDKTMYFSVGGHPAFACPPLEKQGRTECFIKFGDADEIKVTELDMESGLLTGESRNLKLEEGYLQVAEDLFDKDALIIENNQTHQVSLCDSKRKAYLTMNFDAPLFGVWSVPDNNASYICIEPWYGRCDSHDFIGELKDRDWTNSLEPGEIFEHGYEIIKHEICD